MTTTDTARRARRVAAAGVLAGAAAILGVAASPWGRELATLARRDAPARALGSPKLRRALLGTGAIALQPPHRITPSHPQPLSLPQGGRGAPPPVRGDSITGSEAAAADRCPEIEIATAAPAAEDLPSTLLAAPWRERLPEAPLLSLYLDPCRRQRLEANPFAHGRAFEETGWVTFFDRGRLRLAAAAGVRIHGGDSRKRPHHSLRLYFDDRYGASGFPAELLAPNLPGALGRVVLNRDDGRDRTGRRWLFVEAINYDVARRLGVRAPYTRPVALTVDGEPPRIVVLTEQPGPEALRRRLGHDDFEWLRVKEEPGSADSRRRDELTALIRQAPAPLTAAWAAERFDLDLLVDWTVAALVCGTGEPFQALTFRDRTGRVAGGRWSWMLWDMDQSFFDTPNFHRFGVGNDAVGYLFTRRNAGMPPGLLMQRLLREDPGFRRRLAERTLGALRDELTPAFFAELVGGYRLQAQRLGVADLRFLDALDEFFARRRTELPAEIERHL